MVKVAQLLDGTEDLLVHEVEEGNINTFGHKEENYYIFKFEEGVPFTLLNKFAIDYDVKRVLIKGQLIEGGL